MNGITKETSENIYIEDRIAILEKQMEFLQEDINTIKKGTEEFVRVVRCKDCKFYDPLDSNRPYDCLYMESVFGDDYCSRGEKI